MPPKLTTAQARMLTLIQREGAERRCFKSEGPRTTTLNWHWVACHSGTPLHDATLRALVKAGRIEVVKGDLPEQYKDLHPLEVATRNLRSPDRARVVEGGP